MDDFFRFFLFSPPLDDFRCFLFGSPMDDCCLFCTDVDPNFVDFSRAGVYFCLDYFDSG